MSAHPVQRETVRVKRLRWRWGYNRVLLSAVIVAAGAFGVWRAVNPPRAVVERVAATVTLDRPAELYAQQFARAYLSVDARRPQDRQAALSVFDGAAGVLTRGYRPPSSGSRSVRWTSVMQVFAVPQGSRYIVAADTRPDGPLFLAVTVDRASDGALAVVGSPAIVGPPVNEAAREDPSGRSIDDARVERVVTRALGNFLSGAAEDLAADLTTQAVVSLPTRPLALERVTQLRWDEEAVGRVLVSAAVRTERGEVLHLTYELALEQRPDRWLVAGIHNNPTGQ